jgi:hypothetical protein
MTPETARAWARVEDRLEKRGILHRRRRVPPLAMGVAALAGAGALALLVVPRDDGLATRGAPRTRELDFGIRAFVVPPSGEAREVRAPDEIVLAPADRLVVLASNASRAKASLHVAAVRGADVSWAAELVLEPDALEVPVKTEWAHGAVTVHFVFSAGALEKEARERVAAALRAGARPEGVLALVSRRIRPG